MEEAVGRWASVRRSSSRDTSCNGNRRSSHLQLRPLDKISMDVGDLLIGEVVEPSLCDCAHKPVLLCIHANPGAKQSRQFRDPIRTDHDEIGRSPVPAVALQIAAMTLCANDARQVTARAVL